MRIAAMGTDIDVYYDFLLDAKDITILMNSLLSPVLLQRYNILILDHFGCNVFVFGGAKSR